MVKMGSPCELGVDSGNEQSLWSLVEGIGFQGVLGLHMA